MKSMPLIFLLMAISSCNAESKPPHASGLILATCEQGASQKNTKRWPVSKSSFGIALETSVCSELSSTGLKFKTPLHVIPYKNDLADLEFSCDQNDAKAFFSSHPGKPILFILNGTAIGAARISDHPFEDICAILDVPSLKQAISMCESIGTAIGQDKEECWKPCGENDENRWACIANR